MNTKPVIGITMGDPAGIGPEIIAKALASKSLYNQCNPIVVGDAGVMRGIITLLNLSLAVNPVSIPGDSKFKYGTIDIIILPKIFCTTSGQPSGNPDKK